ncbi:unnamed protein product [Cuscuta europaea]|uniref:Pectinesterase inhibitor domain-containing protein n=1 Tax=Cuscuta europaea TaxID=41803 RepID=A0A9P0Z488_CUSEU|nr:unnamed protein product [Cuscuta europaea]
MKMMSNELKYSASPLMSIIITTQLIIMVLFCSGDVCAAEWLSSSSSSSVSAAAASCYRKFVYDACNMEEFINKSLCGETLTPYADYIKGSRRRLAQAALTHSKAQVRDAADFLLDELLQPKAPAATDENAVDLSSKGAMSDCQEQIADAEDQYIPSLAELAKAQPSNKMAFITHTGNAQTWISAALTYFTTCLDGLGGPQAAAAAAAAASSVPSAQAQLINRVYLAANLTEISLAFINRFAHSPTKSCSQYK